MSQDQCPSTSGKAAPSPKRSLPTDRATGQRIWRSVEEVADTAEFRDLLEREFPAGASVLATESRRDFVKLMGAGLALAGAATVPGCRRPDQKTLPYSQKVPEDSIPGQPLYFATSMPLPGGGAEGLLVETHEGRPTKVEGNPLHPNNRGKCSSWALSSVLGIYDPDRLKFPMFNNPSRGPLAATWDDFDAWSADHFASHESNGGAGLALILDKRWSPTRDAVIVDFRNRFPRASITYWESTDATGPTEGSRIAFGSPRREVLDFAKAKIVLSINRNLVLSEGQSLPNARGIAASRGIKHAHDTMSRLYSVESAFTEFGSSADHRMRLAPNRMGTFAVILGREVLKQVGGGNALRSALESANVPEPTLTTDIDTSFVEAVAEDLAAHRGESLVVVDAGQPAHVHALVHAINAALGNLGSTIRTLPANDQEAFDSHAALRSLAKQMSSGAVRTLVCIDTNPVYDAPADLNFASLYAKVETTISLGVGSTETNSASTWRLNGSHYLESWGDTQSWDGTIAPVQPMIAPLYAPARSGIELIAQLSGDQSPNGFELTRRVWRSMISASSDATFEKAWRRALHDGVLTGSTPRPGNEPSVKVGAVAQAVSAGSYPATPTKDSLAVAFTTTAIHDGRFANQAWLQELPHAGTRVVWDNPALLSPSTAIALNVAPRSGVKQPQIKDQLPKARMADITIDGKTTKMAVWIMPGMADNTVLLPLGYGRKTCGSVGTGVGFDVNTIRSSTTPHVVSAATLKRTSGKYEVVSTQNHWSMEGRTSIIRQIDKTYWDQHADEAPEIVPDEIYGAAGPEKRLNLAERMGELGHTPANESIYENPFNRSYSDPDPENPQSPTELGNTPARALNREVPPRFARSPQWGMSIDQTKCTGCGGCIIACQSENNIPVVGKREVAKGREMHWIRVDRYFTGDDINDPGQMLHQPVACVHCENAPCEVVCPVNATSHSPEGINDMVYNRCIGTRYCANNCPYKVRRFNFFDYSQAKYNGGVVDGLQALEKIPNQNLIPPRLRKQLDEIQKMKMNPEVTVRARGVMEKCTYCVQRVNAARHEMKIHDLDGMADGFVQTACEQACPSDAITFGDITDTNSRIYEQREDNRSYMLLGFLNTRPRTTHMLRVNNPNPKLRTPVDPFAGHEAGYENKDGQEGGAHTEHHTFFDNKKTTDRGYALSLKVLSSRAGVLA